MSETDKNNHEEKETTGFKVSDRRKFSAEGELREGEAAEQSSSSSESAPVEESVPVSDSEDREPEDPSKQRSGEQIDFASFVLSLATTALAHLGEVPDPATGEKTENIAAAKQMIDILSILEKKTKGNLKSDEERLLESLLYELRMKYLNKAKIISV
jgi:hypothetical protein